MSASKADKRFAAEALAFYNWLAGFAAALEAVDPALSATLSVNLGEFNSEREAWRDQ